MSKYCRFIAGLWLTVALSQGPINAQVRYIDEVFASVDTRPDSLFAVALGSFNGTMQQVDLFLDLYLPPASDPVQDRPLVILCHAGSFLPTSAQGVGSLGGRKDAALVELANRLARRGFVVACLSYRVGWNPGGQPDEREGTILRAAYRALQDLRATIRMFRHQALNLGNPYRIDPGRIVAGGTQAGGYLPIHHPYLDYNEILNSDRFEDSNGYRYIDTSAQIACVQPPAYNGCLERLGNLDVIGNYQGVSSDIQCAITLGGAIIDTTFLLNNPDVNVPILSMHGDADAVTPYLTDFVAPAALQGTTIFLVSGGGHLIPAAQRAGKQAAIANVPEYAPGFWPGNGSHPGLYTFHGAGFQPFAWYDTSGAASIAKAMLYMDTVLAYICPGMKAALNLPTIVGSPGMADWLSQSLGVYPNPANQLVRIRPSDPGIALQQAVMYDLSGRLVLSQKLNATESSQIDVSGLPAGYYLLKVHTDQGIGVKRLVVQ